MAESGAEQADQDGPQEGIGTALDSDAAYSLDLYAAACTTLRWLMSACTA